MLIAQYARFLAATVLIVTAAGAPSFAPAQSAACPNNLLIGTWRLDVSKSKVTRHDGQIPDRIVIIAPYGADGITRVLIDEGDPRLSGREEHYSLQFDDKFYPTKGGDPRLMQWKRIDCNTYEHTTKRQLIFNKPDGTVKQYIADGQVQSTGIIKISADGKTMTDSHSGTLGDQTKYEGEALVYDRR
jgi:hypothetical protein